jgi:hypothetical protein
VLGSGHANAGAVASSTARPKADGTRSESFPKLLRGLFPGYRFEDHRLPRDVDLVMQHVLSQGGDKHQQWLVRRLGDQGVRAWMSNTVAAA